MGVWNGGGVLFIFSFNSEFVKIRNNNCFWTREKSTINEQKIQQCTGLQTNLQLTLLVAGGHFRPPLTFFSNILDTLKPRWWIFLTFSKTNVGRATENFKYLAWIGVAPGPRKLGGPVRNMCRSVIIMMSVGDIYLCQLCKHLWRLIMTWRDIMHGVWYILPIIVGSIKQRGGLYAITLTSHFLFLAPHMG